MKTRVLTGVVVTVGLLVAAVGVVYAFGTPERGSTAPEVVTSEWPADIQSGPKTAAMTSGGAASASGGSMADSVGEVSADAKAPEADPSSPLAVEIPGCRCHSDDPKLVKQHESYRMNQCAGCHAGKTPTGQ